MKTAQTSWWYGRGCVGGSVAWWAGMVLLLGWLATPVPGMPVIQVQLTNLTLTLGETASLTVVAESPHSLTYQWQKDGSILYNQNDPTLLLRHVGPADAGVYRVSVSDEDGPVHSSARVEVIVPPAEPGCGGALDLQFELREPAVGSFTNFTGSPNPEMITALVPQGDGSVVVGGGFTALGGHIRTGLARLGANGEMDPNFAPALAVQDAVEPVLVRAVVMQSDHKLVVAGRFTHVNGRVVATGLARLLPDGSLDESFRPTHTLSVIQSLAIDNAGRILVGGSASEGWHDVGPQLIRLNPNGVLDRSFEMPSEIEQPVLSILVQSDTRIVVNGLYRFLDSGNRDPQFNPTVAPARISAAALQPDGKILVGGFFQSYWADELVRLNPDGSLDAGFSAGLWLESVPDFIAGAGVAAVAVQPDGRILVGGNFGLVNGVHQHFVARFLTNGTPDLSFAPQFQSCHECDYGEYVSELAITGDGKLLVAGNLSLVNGVPRSNLARLHLVETGCAGIVSLSSDTYLASESNSAVTITITRHGGLDQAASVNYSTLVEEWWFGRPAQPDADYTPVTGTLEFAIGESNRTLVIPLMRDALVEPSESFAIQIDGRPFGTSLGKITRATIHIADESSAGQPGSAVPEFQPALTPGRWEITCIAPQPNGRFVVSGALGLEVAPWFTHLARFEANGALDASFNPAIDGLVRQVIVLPGGEQMLICGDFQTVNGQARRGVACLNANGSLDPTFNAQLDEGQVSAMDRQTNGQIVIYGTFGAVGGVPRRTMARLNANGSLDPGFEVGSPMFQQWGYINALAVQNDGKVVLGGIFHEIRGVPRNHLARLNQDGSLDRGFEPHTNYTSSYSYIQALVLEPDGRIVVGGHLWDFFGRRWPGIARVNPDGTLDNDFRPPAGVEGSVMAIARQPDGKLLIGGNWGSDAQPRVNVARLNSDGSLDPSWFVGFGLVEGDVTALASLVNGDVIAGGYFATANLFPSPQLALLRGNAVNGNGAITLGAARLEVGEESEQAGIRLQRIWGHYGPVSVTVSTSDGTAVAGEDYQALQLTVNWAAGDATDKFVTIPIINDSEGDWNRSLHLTLSGITSGAALGPYATTELVIREDDTVMQFDQTQYRVSETNGTVYLLVWCLGRSRGWTSVDYRTESGTAVAGVHYVATNGTMQLPDAGSGRSIIIPLLNTATVDGERTLLVRLSNPVNGTLGPRQVATITITDGASEAPMITLHPQDQTRFVGESASFTVGVLGSEPLTYQWLQNGAAIPRATNSTLLLGPLEVNANARYAVIVSNAFGIALTSEAQLSVHPRSAYDQALETGPWTWVSGGAAPWFAQSPVTFDGQDAAQSGPISHDQESWIETTVAGPGLLRFRWRISSEGDFDWVQFLLDGIEHARISGETDWEQVEIQVSEGSHTLRWVYLKDASISTGSDAAWLDQLIFAPAQPPEITQQPIDQTVPEGSPAIFQVLAQGLPPLTYQWWFNSTAMPGATNAQLKLQAVTVDQTGQYYVVVSNSQGIATSETVRLEIYDELALGEALDAPQLVWRSGGVNPWLAETNISHDGVDAARSGWIDSYGESWVETRVTGPGLIGFWWRVSGASELYALTFSLDAQLLSELRGRAQWEQHSFSVPAGEHILRWSYERNDDPSYEPDHGWLDSVTFTHDPPVLPVVTGPESHSVTVGDDVTLFVEATGTEPFTFQWQWNGQNIAGENRPVLRLTNVTQAATAQYRVLVGNPAGAISSDHASVVVSPAPITWQWARTGGGTDADAAVAVALDAQGRAYVAGQFSGIANFGTNSFTANGTKDVFVAKYDPQGNLLWIRDISDNGYPTVTGLKLDPAGNLILAGHYLHSPRFGELPSLVPNSGRFVVKLDNTGAVLWNVSFGGLPNYLEYATPELAVDSQGRIAILASFAVEVTIGEWTFSSVGGTDGLLAQISPDGHVEWARNFGSTLWDKTRSLVADRAGNLYFSGEFNGTLTLGTNVLAGQYWYTQPSDYGIFLAKCNAGGEVLWAHTGETNYLHGYDLAIDQNDQLYARSGFHTGAVLGNDVLTASSRGDNYFIAQLNTNGQPVWGRLVTTVGFGSSYGHRLVTDRANHLYLQGLSHGEVVVDGKTLFYEPPLSSFLAAWDSTGALLWTKKLPPDVVDFAAHDGSVVMAGAFYNPIRCGGNWLISQGHTDAFVARLSRAGETLQFIRQPVGLCVTNGQFHLQLRGAIAANPVIIEASSNLVEWIPIFTNNLPTSVMDFTEPFDTTCAARFYRAVVR